MKIDIIGSVASGKTTLAKELAVRYGIPHIEKDDLIWKRSLLGDVKRSPNERDDLFAEVLQQDDWIVEGSPRKSLHESFMMADWIIVLEPPVRVRLWRVIKRWFLQRGGLVDHHGKPTFSYLLKNIKWVLMYNGQMEELQTVLVDHREKMQRFTTANEVKQFLARVY